ncbi:MAG: cation:proton antiporter [Paludibacteraceae bacterium]|nr:cation:proton antiporter [Paludibacteraceae bacterium]
MSLPLTEPIAIFLAVLMVILFANMMNRIYIPQMVGLIIAGAMLGQHGFGVFADEQSFELFGKVGILYIMFCVGMDVDMYSFKREKWKGVMFGIYTFCIPLIIGMAGGYYLIGLTIEQAVLFSGMMTCHTMITYPVVGKMGISNNRTIGIVVAGTLITVILSLVMIAIVVNDTSGAGIAGWTKMGIGSIILGLTAFAVVPNLSKWFFNRFSDGITQYTYVLMVVFALSLMAVAAGLEGILGAFCAGIALNRFIKPTSALRNRILFAGNAIFIPFFLINIGMQIDISAFFDGYNTITTAAIMCGIALFSKLCAARICQWSNRFSWKEGNLIFGLTSGKAAAALAVMVIGQRAGLFDKDVLNGTIIMVFVSIIVSSMVTERAARKIAKSIKGNRGDDTETGIERVMISIGNPQTMRNLIEFGSLVKSKEFHNNLYALKITRSEDGISQGEEELRQATEIAAENENILNSIIKQDINIANCMAQTADENEISDLIVGIHEKANIIDTFLGSMIKSLIEKTSERNFMIFGARNSLPEMRRIVLYVPEGAEKEIGFMLWFSRIRNIAVQGKMKLLIGSNGDTLKTMQGMKKMYKGVECKFTDTSLDLKGLTDKISDRDLLTVIMARKHTISYNAELEKVPNFLSQHSDISFLLIYPRQ